MFYLNEGMSEKSRHTWMSYLELWSIIHPLPLCQCFAHCPQTLRFSLPKDNPSSYHSLVKFLEEKPTHRVSTSLPAIYSITSCNLAPCPLPLFC